MDKYFFEESEKEIKRVSYKEYKNNTSLMKKINDTYNGAEKTIEVEEISHPYQEWEFVLKGEKIILFVKKEFADEKEVTSVRLNIEDEKKTAFMRRGFQRYETYENAEVDLKKVKDVTKKEYYSKEVSLFDNCYLNEDEKYVVAVGNF